MQKEKIATKIICCIQMQETALDDMKHTKDDIYRCVCVSQCLTLLFIVFVDSSSLKNQKPKKKKPHGLCLDAVWGLKASVISWCLEESPESLRLNQRVSNIQLNLN